LFTFVVRIAWRLRAARRPSMLVGMRRVLLVLCLVTTLACSREGPAPAERAVDRAPEQAREAVGRFKRELKGALSAALAEGGPTHALTVCQREAPRLAAAASRPGLAIGRATLRPRNPDNLAVGWKLDAYHALAGAADRATATYTAELPSGAFAYAEPLVIDGVCLSCHGSVGGDVAAALRERYPDDRATGYALGDLRGIAWAEVTRGP
jgi:hypothetical protein